MGIGIDKEILKELQNLNAHFSGKREAVAGIVATELVQSGPSMTEVLDVQTQILDQLKILNQHASGDDHRPPDEPDRDPSTGEDAGTPAGESMQQGEVKNAEASGDSSKTQEPETSS